MIISPASVRCRSISRSPHDLLDDLLDSLLRGQGHQRFRLKVEQASAGWEQCRLRHGVDQDRKRSAPGGSMPTVLSAMINWRPGGPTELPS